MTEPTPPEYPGDIQPEDVLPPEAEAQCSLGVNIDGTPVGCRLSNHRNSLMHMGFYQDQPFMWST